jgi:hypothetical protein
MSRRVLVAVLLPLLACGFGCDSAEENCCRGDVCGFSPDANGDCRGPTGPPMGSPSRWVGVQPTVLASEPLDDRAALAVLGTSVVYTLMDTSGTRRVRRVPLAGGEPVDVGVGGSVIALATGSSTFGVDSGTKAVDYADGRILRVTPEAGVSPISAGEPWPRAIAWSAGMLYVALRGSIVRLREDGSERAELAAAVEPTAIAVGDDGAVYFASGASIQRLGAGGAAPQEIAHRSGATFVHLVWIQGALCAMTAGELVRIAVDGTIFTLAEGISAFTADGERLHAAINERLVEIAPASGQRTEIARHENSSSSTYVLAGEGNVLLAGTSEGVLRFDLP